MRIHLQIISVLMLTGCASASLVQRVYEPTKGGVVKYKNSLFGGGPSAEKAQTLMANYCAPSAYRVIQEQASVETIGYNANTNGATYGNYYNQSTQVTPVERSYIYVQFQCNRRRSISSISSKSSKSTISRKSAHCQDECNKKDANHAFKDGETIENCLRDACK